MIHFILGTQISSRSYFFFLFYIFTFLHFSQVPFLPGESDLGQLSKIFETLGTPTEADWKVCSKFKLKKPEVF